ncbi:hypothetical protein KBA73_04510 [Patescibacteria group bacterium]|nr:hypothetical protein [Patescibacteria group bacterium]
MLLSHTDSPFEHTTLIVRADHSHAELWLGMALELTHLETVAQPELPAHDHSSGFMNPNHSSTSTGEIHDDEGEREYLVQLEKSIIRHFSEQHPLSLWFVMDTELIRRVHKKLPAEIQSKITLCLSHTLLKEEMSVVIARTRAEGVKFVS